MSVKTSIEVENYIPKLLKQLHLENSEPKWVALRFFINISISINSSKEFSENILNGSEYRLEQITGKGKEIEDYTSHYKKMLEIFNNIEFLTEKDFEKALEQHIERGFFIISTSIRENGDIFLFLKEEFSRLY